MTKSVIFLLFVCTFWTQAVHLQRKANGGRIIGGTSAHAAQFPFSAAIYKNTADGTFFCVGALINDQWILTAGQCVDGARLFTIRLGSNQLNSNDPNALRLSTEHYFLHPDYNANTLENDIGLIKLRLPITFTDYIKPISVLATTPIPAGSSVTTVGWGQTSDEEAGLVEDLNFVFLVALTNEECRLVFGNQIVDTMVCAAGNYNEGICRGDVGSPLIQYGGSSLIYHVGIASFMSGNGCETTDPSGFTRTAPHVTWINNITASN